MTVVIIADFGYYEGGAAKVALDSVKLLHQAGYTVILLCGSDKVDPSIAALGIRIEKLGMYQLKDNPSKINAMLTGIWNAKAAARLKALLGELDPAKTIVHIHTWTKILSASIFSVLRKSGFKTVMTCHDYFLTCPNGAYYDFVHNEICARSGGGLRCLICNCDSRSYIQKIWRWVRQQVVHSQIKRFRSLKLCTISDLSDEVIKSALGTRYSFERLNNPIKVKSAGLNTIDGKSDFFFVGRAAKEKGLALFADAIHKSGVHGVVVGDGPELERIRSKYPDLECLGWKSTADVSQIVRDKAAVFVFPSCLYEGAPLTPLEMMSLHIPCIISDVTAAKEYIENGKTGLLFKSGDIDDLKRQINRMKKTDFRNWMSENICKDFAIDKWSDETYIKRLSALYDEEERVNE